MWRVGEERSGADGFECRIAYDESHLYLSADVRDADVRGTHTAPRTAVFEDDAIEFFFEVDRARALDRTPRTFEYGFSAAGGYSNVTGRGGGDGTRYPGYIWPPSFASKIEFATVLKPDTTLNHAGDLDRGFVVEARIPWSEWGVEGAAMIGRSMGFNVLKVRRPGSHPPLGLAAGITFENNHNPSLWRNLSLFHPSRLTPHPPGDIDGPAATSRPLTRKIVATHYFYWYRWPDHHFFDDGKHTDDALQDHFADAEPVSFDSPAWHGKELRDVMAAGIDVILPVYWGVPDRYLRGGVAFSVLGLPPLVEALDGIASEGRAPPRVGLFYDTSTLLTGVRALDEPGKVLDLTTGHGMEVFYRTIRDFFILVPRRHWATVGGRPLVVLYASFGAKHSEKTFAYLDRRFEEEFGCRPHVVRNADWRAPTDTVTSWGAALQGPKIVGPTPPGNVVQIGPGYNDRAVPGRTTPIRLRDDGRFYEMSWRKAIESGRDIVLIETWNELHEGTEICETREHGRRYIDLTAKYVAAFKQGLPLPPMDYTPSLLIVQRSDRGAEYASAEIVSYEPTREAGVYHPTDLGDGRSRLVTIDGAEALRSAPNEYSDSRYLYFRVADPFIFNGTTPVEIAVEYLDDAGGAFELQYDSSDREAPHLGAYKPAAMTDGGGDGKWKTGTWLLPDARFGNRQNGLADFRLRATGIDLTVRKVTIRRLRQSDRESAIRQPDGRSGWRWC